MGNNSSILSTESYSGVPKVSFSLLWTHQQTKNDPLYGDIKIFSSFEGSEKQMVALKSFTFSDEKQFKAMLSHLKGNKDFEVPSLIKVKDIETIEDTKFCSQFLKICITYEYYEKTLRDEIAQKIATSSVYSESEIFLIIDCILSALIFLDFRAKENCNLSPSKVLSAGSIYKLTDQSSLTGMTDYQRLFINAVDEEDWVVAPEIMKELAKRTPKPIVNFQKASVFNLGMICLQLATLLKPQQFSIYNFDNFSLDEQALKQYLFTLYELNDYSSKDGIKYKQLEMFKEFVTYLLTVNPDQRWTFKEVLDNLVHLQGSLSRMSLRNSSKIRGESSDKQRISPGGSGSLQKISRSSHSSSEGKKDFHLKESQMSRKLFPEQQQQQNAPSEQSTTPLLDKKQRARQQYLNRNIVKVPKKGQTQKPRNLNKVPVSEAPKKTKQLYNLDAGSSQGTASINKKWQKSSKVNYKSK